MRRLIGGLLALVLAGAAGSAAAEPALWAVHGKASTVYLFGTVHVLRKDTAWRSPKIRRRPGALPVTSGWRSRDGGDATNAQDLMESLGMDRAHPLSTKAPLPTSPGWPVVAKALGAAGGEVLFEPMQPWFAALTISLAPHCRGRIRPAERRGQGAAGRGHRRRQARSRLRDRQRPVALPRRPARPLAGAVPESALDDFDKGPGKLDTLVADWTQGDVDAIAGSELTDMKAKQPQIYRTLLSDRNTRFAKAIAERLKSPGVSFVAVGAAHLAGPDSVQARLAELGIVAERQ